MRNPNTTSSSAASPAPSISVAAPTTKETNQKTHSTKKVKIDGNEDFASDAFVVETTPTLYKDCLVGKDVAMKEHFLDLNIDPKDIIDGVREDICACLDIEDEETMHEHPFSPKPNIKVVVVTYDRRCRLWQHLLIVKLLGKKISLNFLSLRLKKMWTKTGILETVDLHEDYFLVRFT